jgi:hypothetical protein
MLMHAPLAAGQLILMPPAISGVRLVTFDLLFAAALWIVVAAVAASGSLTTAVRARVTP